MSNDFPSYEKTFNETNRRLKSLKKLGEKKSGQLEPTDQFLFLIVGNIKLRINTIFCLLENGITDGVLPLQRTVFEMQVAFKAYSSSDEKEKFIYFYNTKDVLESSFKWDRLMGKSKLNVFTENDKKITKTTNDEVTDEIKKNTKMRKTQNLYELGGGKSLNSLSNEYYTSELYFMNFDEPSNWIHPQRLNFNLNYNEFTQDMSDNHFKFVVNNLIWEISEMANDIGEIGKYYKIVKSQPLQTFFENVDKIIKALQNLNQSN